jgi:hypothetical protein
MYMSTADHEVEQILDVNGHVHLVIKKQEFITFVLKHTVAQSHYMLVWWDQLDIQLKKIKVLFEDTTTGIRAEHLLPDDLTEESWCLHMLLRKIRLGVVEQISQYTASAGLRSQYTRPTAVSVHCNKHANYD